MSKVYHNIIAGIVLVVALTSGSSHAFSTYLVDIRQESDLSRKMSSYGSQGIEDAKGNRVSFQPWYGHRWTDSSIVWMTQISPSWGVTWGFSTGEKGVKYTISPTLKLGLVFQQPLDRRSSLSMRANVLLGGRLKERSCIASYGDIGGEHEVNCRLSATELAPEETLKYMFNERLARRNELLIQYKLVF